MGWWQELWRTKQDVQHKHETEVAAGSQLLENINIPKHIAIIMDGNGRWAKARGMPRAAGHQAGVDNIKRILEHCVQRGVKVLSIYAFSTENWSRPAEEVSGLMRLLGLTIQRQLNELHKNGVRILHSGRGDVDGKETADETACFHPGQVQMALALGP